MDFIAPVLPSSCHLLTFNLWHSPVSMFLSLFFCSLLTPYGVLKTVSPNHIPLHEVLMLQNRLYLFCVCI